MVVIEHQTRRSKITKNPRSQNDHTQDQILKQSTTTMDDAWNTNPLRYIIRDYCKRYPDDWGDMKIRDEDVIRPYNYKYTFGTEEQKAWRKIRDAAIPTYGMCSV